jgi:hypothetical protein
MSETLVWTRLPSAQITILGLPFTQRKSWQRFDHEQLSRLPKAVAEQAAYPAGARLRFLSETSCLSLRLQYLSSAADSGIDVLVDGQLWRTLSCTEISSETEVSVFSGVPKQKRLFELYLPLDQSLSVLALGIDDSARLDPAPISNKTAPIVFYGSSIVQGAGSHLSCMTYPAILARNLNVDFINFGFYGSGRGEPEVLEEMLKAPASQWVIDLGKSFGKQPTAVYRDMLVRVRQHQPNVPIVCITPIFCNKELYSEGMKRLSDSLRQQVHDAARGLGEITVVDGLSLLGKSDWAGLSNDGLHPSEAGFTLIASRLQPYCSGSRSI